MNKLLFSGVLLVTASDALAGVWSLNNDFSSTVNPNGPWTFLKNPTTPFPICQPNYYQNSTNFASWADQPWPQQAHVPTWGKTPSDNFTGLDIQAGHILMHGAETDRTGTDYTAARWTSSETGTATISGRIWNVRNLGRTMQWRIKKDGLTVSQGSITGGDGSTFANPQNWSTGTGGTAALVQSVVPGTTLELGITSVPANLGEMLGLVFDIATSSPSRISGTVSLSDFIGSFGGRTMTCEVWSGSTLIQKPTITLGSGGAYTFDPTPNGACTLRFRMRSSLIKTVSLSLGSSPQVLNLALTNGDVDASGEVDAVDIDEVIASFGGTGDSASDVDGSQEVDAVDIDIVIARFGSVDE